MKIGIVGAGKTGCALAVGLKNEGFEICGIKSRTSESAKYLNKKLGTDFKNSLTDTVKKSDAVFIAVSDSSINEVDKDIITRIDKKHIKNKVFLHLSGALTSEELAGIAQEGGFTGSLHPLQTFADKNNGWKGLYNIYFGFEGSKEAKLFSKAIIDALKGKMLVIPKENKPIYHAASCIMSNYTVTLSYICGCLFEYMGIDFDVGIKALMPLLSKTSSNINELGCIKAFTGPVERGDHEVIKRHIDAINQTHPEFIKAYKELGRAAIKVASIKESISGKEIKTLTEVFK